MTSLQTDDWPCFELSQIGPVIEYHPLLFSVVVALKIAPGKLRLVTSNLDVGEWFLNPLLLGFAYENIELAVKLRAKSGGQEF